MSARDIAERQVAEAMGVSVEQVLEQERAEVEYARGLDVPVESVGVMYGLVQRQLYANLRH